MNPPFDPVGRPLAPGITIVEASAGTGKTWALTRVVVRALLSGEVEPDQVLLMTFTNAARDELASRLRKLLEECASASGPPDGLRAAGVGIPREQTQRIAALLASVDRIAVRTIHGFCADVLADEAFAAGLPFDLQLLADDSDLRQRAAGVAWRRMFATHPSLAAFTHAGSFTAIAKAAWAVHARSQTQVVPHGIDLTQVATELAAARSQLCAAWTPTNIARLSGLGWKANQTQPRLTDPNLVEAITHIALGRDDAVDPSVWKSLKLLVDPTEKLFLAKFPDHPVIWSTSATALALTALMAAVARVRIAMISTVATLAEIERRALATRARIRTTDDLLREVAEALADPALGPGLAQRLAGRWPLVCVDEFQDTDSRQWDIFRTAFATKRLLLIGDPKQSIYAFRAADVRVYAAAREATPANARFGLTINRRSDEGIVRAVDALFSRHGEPYADAAVAHASSQALTTPPLRLNDPLPERRPFHIWTGNGLDLRGAIAIVVAELQRLIVGGVTLDEANTKTQRVLGAGDCCVLVRDHREAAMVQDACAAAGLPAVLAATGDVLETDEARELATVLRGILEPGPRHVRAAAATVIWGWSASDLRDANADPSQWAALLSQLAHLRLLWHRHGVGAAVDRLYSERATFARLAGLREAERRITNLRHLAELLARSAAESHAPPEQLVRWLSGEHDAERDECELRLESDAAKIRVMTIHRAKGLEFPVVMLPTLWLDGPKAPKPDHVVAVPDSAGWALHLDPETRDLEPWLRFEVGESARRLYVALTRAKARCGMVWATGRTTGRSDVTSFPIASTSMRGVALSGLAWQLVAPRSDGGTWMLGQWQLSKGTVDVMVPQLAQLADEARVAVDAWITVCAASHTVIDAIPPLRPIAMATSTSAYPTTAQILPAAAQTHIDDRWRTTSFTNLVRGAEVPAILRDPEVRDQTSDSAAGPLHGFAAGADAGDALHDVLEHWDPAQTPDTAAIATILTEHGLGAGSPRHAAGCVPAERVAELLRLLARTPMPQRHGAPFMLAASITDARCPEWGFHLPLERLSAADIANAIRTHDPELHAHCGPQLALLGTAPVHGFLKGFVDLVVRHDGRWHVIDWKSNRLGAQPDDYTTDRLWEAMAHSHYAVQAVLYLVALHRWLRVSVRDYEPKLHLGGAWYVFLRGLAPNGSNGIVTLQPTMALITALDQRIGGKP